MSEFLLEILAEEIPAGVLPGAREDLLARVSNAFAEARLGGTLAVHSTSRRLILVGEGVADRQPDERPLHAQDRLVQAVDRPAQPEPQVRGDLIVARSAGVEAPGQRPDPLPECQLEVHVDIFERRVPHDGAGLDFAAQPLQAGHEHGHLSARKKAGAAQAVDVSYRSGNVVGRERAVEIDRAGEVRHPFVSRALESTAPEPHDPPPSCQ